MATVSVVAALMAVAAPVAASDCDTSSTEYVCTGDVLETDIDATDLDDDVTTILFEDVDSSDGEGTYFFWVDNTGDEGNSHGDDGDDVDWIQATFADSDTSIVLESGGDEPAMSLTGQGGKGHSGKDRTTDTSSGKGGNGGDGGDVLGTQSITFDLGSVTGDAAGAVSVTASGGDGGSGGKGRSYGTSDGEGGDGGDGGAGQYAEYYMGFEAELDISSTEDNTPGIYVISSGGEGNDGGKGEGGVNAKGGDGGAGGDASDALLYAEGDASLTISTDASNAPGIEVLSQGGDGGDGGKGTESTGDSKGGDGGAGGSAGDVTVYIDDASTTITTNGTDSIGILARSYGGAGGDGGDADSTFGSGTGGSSEEPGPAGDVKVTFNGTILTTGDGDSSDDDGDDATTTSSGILAQSVGGFAGDAGDSTGLFVAYGASSESAGDAGDVTVGIGGTSSITTQGSYSVGVEAQSIGGGGGKGGSSDAIDSVGGDGSSGGDGGTVTVTLDAGAIVSTSKNNSAAVSAQSVGGGGGKSGGASGVVSSGGTGGDGGDGGDVTVNLGATLNTDEDYSEGVFAQSLGGGGGTAKSTSGWIETLGGSGGDGGNSGTVEVIHSAGDITTLGADSDGVDIQSVGGGGGKGSSATSVGLEYSLAVGGAGGDGGDGGTVSYSEDPDTDVADYLISTGDEFSSGITVQSGGGGGGNSGSAVNVTASVGVGVIVGATEDAGAGGDGADVTVDTIAAITTTGAHSDGIFAQSYGGGGGNAGTVVDVSASYDLTAVSVSTGGAGGTGGDASTVEVTSTGEIQTGDDHSHGIYAQSSGGGGGKSSSVYTVNGVSMGSVSVTTGATGGDGGDASTVKVDNSGDITTTGEKSTAIFAQSAGGGGGSSGTTFDLDVISTVSVGIAVGGDGGGGGSADDVSVTNSGTLTTGDSGSDGIFAQSIGGGGGDSGSTYSGSGFSATSVSVAVGGDGGSGDTENASGAVTVKNTGDITVTGENSSGIYAESRGGGGGKSGMTMSFSTVSLGDAAVAVGGEGGDGGTAGTVNVTNEGTIKATGANNIGIYANSQGGEGGNSGTVVSASGVTGSSITVGIGGGGGDGGTASAASVYNYGEVQTTQDLSYGILAQSIGGAGGNGSDVVTAEVSGLLSDATDGISGNVSFSLGGDGGSGGVAGQTYVENGANITTDGAKAYGILAQSIGGNGGSGGSVYSFNLELGAASAIDFSASIGGSGAGGAASNKVTVQNDAAIETYGIYGHGIFGQSVGGSGGAGGSVITATASTATTVDLGVSLAVGGEGGDGSVGNEVDITNYGSIIANSAGGIGIYAQSIGGDGGDGGSATAYVLDYTLAEADGISISASWSMGGTGGSGNDADLVTVLNSGSIDTYGTSGDAIFAQSVGGGGGDGGSAEATSISFIDNPDDFSSLGIEVALEIGGSGGSGGDGGEVKVTNDGTISTTQDVAMGIFAQSVGGGGGTGGESGSTSSVTTENASTWEDYAELVNLDFVDALVSSYTLYSLYSNYSSYFTNWTVSVGGSGGAGGNGDTVTVSNTDEIETGGADSTAIYAQSVGGGGGAGGTGTSASIKTKLIAGGSGAAGGHGGDVTVNNSGKISTTGQRGNGIWAQSVGGGGGDAGDVEGGFGAFLDDATNDTIDSYDSDSDFELNFSLDIGANYDGDSGNGGDGRTVAVTSTGADITTTGKSAVGIWAQSVGGGGGTAGSIALSLYVAGSNGDAGDSGDVSVALDDASVSSSGDYSIAVFAQSSSGSYQEADDTSSVDASFTYDGDDSYDAGDIAIELTDSSSIAASGTYSRAILAASTGYDEAGTVSILVDETSSITGSDGNASVINIYDGNTNRITNYGTIADEDYTDADRTDSVYVVRTKITSSDYDGYTSDGNAKLKLFNYGTLSGAIKLHGDGTSNKVYNQDGGTFNTGSIVDIGDGSATFMNYGILSPGGIDSLFTTTISGGKTKQTSSGSIAVDLEMNTASDDEDADLIVAEKVTLLEGALSVNATGTNDVSDGDSGSVYVMVADKIRNADLEAQDSAIVDYEAEVLTNQDVTVNGTSYSDKDVVELSYTIDIGSSGASVNATELSSYVSTSSSDDDSDDDSDSSAAASGSAAVSSAAAAPSAAAASSTLAVSDTAGSSADSGVRAGMKSLFSDLMNAGTAEELDTLASTHVVDEAGAALFAARQASLVVHNTLRSCPSISRSGARDFLQERDCFWVGFVGTDSQYDNDAGGTSFDERSFGLAAGGQRVMDNGFILGGMIRGEDVTLNGDNFEQDGTRFTFGAVFKLEDGPWTYSLSAAYGRQALDQTRNYLVGGTDYVATSDITSHVFSSDARVTYLQDFDKNYLRWGLGLGLYYTQQDGFSESGTGPLNWTMQGTDQTDVVLRPSLEFGRTFGRNNDEGRIFVVAGLAANLTDPDNTVYGSLNGAGGASMAHVFEYDRVAAEIGVGLDYQLRDNMRISLRGGGTFSENARTSDFSATIRWLF
ncbi:MAG: hypothetical protein AAGF79_01165 [Pseudomonadota bacterium]